MYGYKKPRLKFYCGYKELEKMIQQTKQEMKTGNSFFVFWLAESVFYWVDEWKHQARI